MCNSFFIRVIVSLYQGITMCLYHKLKMIGEKIMKKGYLFFTLCLLLLAGCSNEYINNDEDDFVIWDFVNYSIPISVINEAGNDLLDSTVVGNILKNDIILTYKTKEFKIEKRPATETRFNMPEPLGLRLRHTTYQPVYYLTFGEFSPAKNYKAETFTINWGDGTTDVIKFDIYITWKSKNEPEVHTAVYLNNKLYEKEGLIQIIKKN